LGISVAETTFARRGFQPTAPAVQQHLERVGRAFVHGYQAALESSALPALVGRLLACAPEFRGFAFEGAAMASALLDACTPWRPDRVRRLMAGPGADHIYMLHVGVGWALARLPVRLERAITRFDPLLRWLIVDGYGFHAGYFNWPRTIDRQEQPRQLSAYARRVFDQGLGRSLWFVKGADIARIQATVAAFPAARQPDLWGGVGLACAYAGGVDAAAIEALQRAAEPYQLCLAQGAAFAAQARLRANLAAPHTEMACAILCGGSLAEAAAVTQQALADLRDDAATPAYDQWQQRIRSFFVERISVS
jgi:hypothetical protein